MARAPGAPCSHGFFQLFQKRRYWRAMPGGIHRGVPTAPGSFLQKKEKNRKNRKKEAAKKKKRKKQEKGKKRHTYKNSGNIAKNR